MVGEQIVRLAGDLGLGAAAGGDAFAEALRHDRRDGAAAHASREPVADEVVEVAAHRHDRDAESVGGGFEADAAGLGQHLDEA